MTRNWILNKSKEHVGVLLYSVVLLILTYGVVLTSGTVYLHYLLMIWLVTFTMYFVAKRWLIFPFYKVLRIKFLSENMIGTCLFLTCTLIFILDLFFCKGLPILHYKDISTLNEFTELRANIYENTPSLQIYLSSWNIKAFIPFTLIFLYLNKRKLLFTLLLILAVVYALSMMQKSLILSVLFPLIIVGIFQKRVFFVILLLSISLSVIMGLVAMTSHYIHNTRVEQPVNTDHLELSLGGKMYRYTYGIYKRVMIVPGEMVAEWFRVIPKEKPFLNGDGYNFISKLRGTTYHDYSTELYPLIRPYYVERGLSGTVNVASFMRGYSNFGMFGLIVSCAIISLFLANLEVIFRDDKNLFIAINCFPIFLLSSGNLLTLLVSGGWIVLICLSILFKNHLTKVN